MVLLKMLMEIALPKMGVVGDDDDDDFPLREGSSPRQNRSVGGQKCSCPSSTSRRGRFVPNVLPLFFSRSKMTYILEDGHQRWAEEGTTHQGAPGLPGMPRWVVPTWWAPSGTYLSNIHHIFHKNSQWSFSLFGVVQNR